ncbi:MAG: hypothetical protein K6F50_04540 [Kiritimatiellae bacterium]|nr:hypothetical protein [Kiritimatiellia bacterium]
MIDFAPLGISPASMPASPAGDTIAEFGECGASSKAAQLPPLEDSVARFQAAMHGDGPNHSALWLYASAMQAGPYVAEESADHPVAAAEGLVAAEAPVLAGEHAIIDAPVAVAQPAPAPVAADKPTVVPVTVSKPAEDPVSSDKSVAVAQPAQVPVTGENTPTIAPVAVVDKPAEAPVSSDKPTAVTPPAPTADAPAQLEQAPVAVDKPTVVPVAADKPAEVTVSIDKPVAVAQPEQTPVTVDSPAVAPVTAENAESSVVAAKKPVAPSTPAKPEEDDESMKSPGAIHASPASVTPLTPTGIAPVLTAAEVSAAEANAASARTREVVSAVETVAATVSVTPGLAKGEGEVKIVLKPDVLDGSEIRVEAKGSALTVAITPATPEVAQIMERNISQFQQHLASRIPAFAVTVSVTPRKGKTNETV